jgi:hypothetical protein
VISKPDLDAALTAEASANGKTNGKTNSRPKRARTARTPSS